jgi:hypothetical protein
MNRSGTVGGGDSSGDILAGIDRHRKGRPKGRGILNGLLGQLKLLDPLRRERQTNQPTRMLGHEIDGLRGDFLRRDDEIAFILPVFVVYQDDELALLNVPNRAFDTVKRRSHCWMSGMVNG